MQISQFGMPNMPVQPRLPAQNDPKAVLFVGNLDKDLDDQRLHEIFSQFGAVNQVRIMRDMYSGESRGFCFVTYARAQDAYRAKQTLNYTRIQDNTIIIREYRSKPQELDAKANIFISNLDPEFSARELEARCEEFGRVVSVLVRENEQGRGIGYAYVQFETEAEAQVCIKELNGKKLGNAEVKTGPFVPRNERPKPPLRNNLYIKNFPELFDQQ